MSEHGLNKIPIVPAIACLGLLPLVSAAEPAATGITTDSALPMFLRLGAVQN